MKKMCRAVLAAACYLMGVVASLYVGGWMMLVKPVKILMQMFRSGSMDYSSW